jgi:hypothetical protein
MTGRHDFTRLRSLVLSTSVGLIQARHALIHAAMPRLRNNAKPVEPHPSPSACLRSDS